MESISKKPLKKSSEVENSSKYMKTSHRSTPIRRMTKCDEQYSMLSHEELVSRLINAHAKIEELEAACSATSVNPTVRKNTSRQKLHTDESKGETEETQTDDTYSNQLVDSQSRPTFAYLSNTSSSMISSPDGVQLLIRELQAKLQDFSLGDNYNVKNEKEDDFVVAYEYRGDFPNCDEDLSHIENSENSSHSGSFMWDNENQQSIQMKGQFFRNEDNKEDDDDTCSMDDDTVEEFPLIPSPVLNTPPYEYIFLTKENEAKVRIFLNPKLNQVFQEELTKMHQTEEEHVHFLDSKNSTQHCCIGTMQNVEKNHNMDVNNRNHLVNCTSLDEVKNTFSSSNVIHCFDPSDVDLELKKMFMEKPPITHKIIRRKSRRERGSSVPAVDSYYGTGDLNKVGHASYFIPALTDSERKSIGWKNEYHYGHWKYSTLNFPTARANQIPLHPHPHLESSSRSKHNHHHHEADLPIPFLIDSDAISILESPTSPLPCDNTPNEDTLSFITLSGSTPISQSCHVIPDKSALKRILHWILPCVKTNHSESNSSINRGTSGSDNHCKECISEAKENNDDTDENEDDQTEPDVDTLLETLVEPSDKLHTPTSHFQISFAVGAKSGQLHSHHRYFPQGNHIQDSNHSNHNDCEDEDQESQHHHKHHHHGFLHWKHILTHGSRSVDSMSVMGGDVVESNPRMDVVHINQVNVEESIAGAIRESNAKLGEDNTMKGKARKVIDNVYDTTSDDISTDDEEDQINRDWKQSHGKKLKHCKAYTKLLTLKDLGYKSEDEVIETDEETNEGEDSIKNTEVVIPQVSKFSKDTDTDTHESSNTGKMRKTSKRRNRNRASASRVRNHKNGGQCNRTKKDGSSSDMGASGNDGDDDFSSGYPFSPTTLSEQNSFTTTHFCDDLESNSHVPTVSHGHTETRFLDPKDLLTQQYQESKGYNSSLPFVYDFEGNLDGTIDYDENVIQWMDQNFVQEIEEELGLLNSCLDAVLIKGLLTKGNVGTVGAQQADNEDFPEKTNGQHRIFTLNQRSQENHIDIENENLK